MILKTWLLVTVLAGLNAIADTNDFDGRPWNVSSGNLSVGFIQSCPIGAFPKPDFREPAPSVESQARLRKMGLVANEDYLAWGAIEREPGKWSWPQHDAMETNLHAAGLKYVTYTWLHFPPVWLRDQQTNNRTLMRCMEHGKEANYLSIFDPRTIGWYDHFYKHLHEHFGDRIDDVYACILGPYGEGNYPLMVPDWVNMGHCHEGYWCDDTFAHGAFQVAMKQKYHEITALNKAWGTNYTAFDSVQMPPELKTEKFTASVKAFTTPEARRRWLDFITWYHQAIIDFTEQSIKTVLKYYPAEKIRAKPGGSAGGVNPIPWGTYCPGYAKMAQPYHIVLQPADCQGAVFADKWMGTAYQFYHVTECTEPAGNLDEKNFTRRMFSDAAAGARQFFTYEFEQHAPTMQKYLHLITGVAGETETAIYCPTTLYRLGDNLHTTISVAWAVRDLTDFDVLDELLISDGALSTNRYKTMVLFQGEIIDQPILDKMAHFTQAGGKIICCGDFPVRNVENQEWPTAREVIRNSFSTNNFNWLKDLGQKLAGNKGLDGKLDGIWTCKRGAQTFLFNNTANTNETKVVGQTVRLLPFSIWSN
jgi:hypothetical protein